MIRALVLILACATVLHGQPAPPAPVPSNNLQYFVSAGGGAVVPGHGGKFFYWSVSRYLGQQTYATVATEYTIQKGAVVTCPLAGVSKVLYTLGPVTVGLTGLGGACDANSAANAQGFVNFHVKGLFYLVLTGQKTYTAASKAAFQFTLAPGWGK